MKVSYFLLLLNICCIASLLKTVIFCTFWRLKTLVLWRKIVRNLLIFVYLFCPENSTIDSRKTSITQEWLLVEICPTLHWIAFLMLYWLVTDMWFYFNEPSFGLKCLLVLLELSHKKSKIKKKTFTLSLTLRTRSSVWNLKSKTKKMPLI